MDLQVFAKFNSLSLSLSVRRRNFNAAINSWEKMRQSFNSYGSECAKRSDTFWIWNCQAVFYDFYGSIQTKRGKDGKGRRRNSPAPNTSLTQSYLLHVSKPKSLSNYNHIQPYPTISNHIQPYPTISNRTIVAPRVFQRPLHRLHIDTHGFLLVRHRSMPRTAAEHCHDQSNTPSIFSVYSCVNIVYVYTYIHIHTYITLHYITLHYIITLHNYITLHYIALHYIT